MALAQKKKYHLILLDHMMPEPDGIQVLHRLKEENNPNVQTPVIILTANAVAGIKEWYKKEGFDDYLSKPIIAEKLEKMIRAYLPEELLILSADVEKVTSDTVKEAIEGEVSEAVSEIKSTALIDPVVGLGYCMNDEELYYDILQTYYEQGNSYREKLEELYRQSEWKDFAIIVHAIKSTSLNIGAAEMSELAKAMEEFAKADECEKLQNGWQEFIDLYQQVLAQAEEILQKNQKEEVVAETVTIQAETKAVMTKEDYVRECEILLEHIRAYAMQEAMEQIEKLQKVICSEAEQETETMLSKVSMAVEGFSYDEAEEILSEWLPLSEAEDNE